MAASEKASHLYRQLLYAASAVRTDSQRSMMLKQIREEFRRGRKIADPGRYVQRFAGVFCARLIVLSCRAANAMKTARKELRNINSTLPRVAKLRLEARQRLNGEQSATAYVVKKGGEVVEGQGAPIATAAHRGSGLDPDQLAKHNANLRRFKFMDRGVSAPRGPQWER